MPEFSAQVISLFQKRAAAEPGGLLSGKDPTQFNPHEPIRLWIVQVGIIICTANLLALGLRKMRQPKVIAEVLGGIILGPTAFGRIPGFTEHIFPHDSRPYLSLVATIGLCLFLFLVGLEIDGGVIKRNARQSTIVAMAGMVIPFGLGAGLAVPIYERFIDPSVQFTHFMLFTGVAFSITAFPVLCRILTELKLLDTTVGIVVLSAGVGNDIIGWVLLALSVALVNAGSGLTALYILLVAVGWTLFILFPMRWVIRWIARATGSIESGPSVFFMTATIVVLFGSAFFTDIIGVHAIFGAFLAGLIVPREGGLAIALTEKLEDMVTVLFLPLYFTLSGLSTDLGMLNDGVTWGFTIAIIVTAFVGKFCGCTVAARYFAGFNWRESSTIGSLMSCKGLVELIVLNVGLSAGILSTRVFSMFVLEALVLTFATTPLVTWLYPPKYRVRIATTGANFNNVADGGETGTKPRRPHSHRSGPYKARFTVVLDKFEHLSGMMALTQLINPSVLVSAWSPEDASSVGGPWSRQQQQRPSDESVKSYARRASQVVVEAFRVIELSDRVSAVMKSSAVQTLLRRDPLLAAFRMFGTLNDIKIVSNLAVVKHEELAISVVEHARRTDSDLIMIPWLPPVNDPYAEVNVGRQGAKEGGGGGGGAKDTGEPGTAATERPPTPSLGLKSPSTAGPLNMLFKKTPAENSASVIHSQFVRGVFSQATTDVALYVDQSAFDASVGGGGGAGRLGAGQHLFLPFFGGPDDRAALELVMQLVENPRVSATVVRLRRCEPATAGIGSSVEGGSAVEDDGSLRVREEVNQLTVGSSVFGVLDTVYGQNNTETRLQSDTADNVLWAKYAHLPNRRNRKDSTAGNSSLKTGGGFSASAAYYSRVEFREVSTHVLLHTAVNEAKQYAGASVDGDSDFEDEEDGSEGEDDEGKGSDVDGDLEVPQLTLRKSVSGGGRSSRSDGKERREAAAPEDEIIRTIPRSGVPRKSSLLRRDTGKSGKSLKRPRKDYGRLVVVTGRSRRLAVEDLSEELGELMEEYGTVGVEVRKAMGDVASAFVVAGVGAGVLVLQAASDGGAPDN